MALNRQQYSKQCLRRGYLQKRNATLTIQTEILKKSPLLNTFPKNQKFVLADRIQNHLSDCYEDLLRAYYASRPDEKKKALQQANLTIEMLRNYFRLCNELRLLSFKQYTQCSQQLNEVGRMIGGWLKYLN